MRKIVFLWIALFATALSSYADDKVTFTASAPDVVAVGDQFRLSYTVSTQNVKDFPNCAVSMLLFWKIN